jgi:hypothetical protein
MSEAAAANDGTEQAAKKSRKPRSASKYVGLTQINTGIAGTTLAYVAAYWGKSPKDIKAQVKNEDEIVWIIRDHDKFQAVVQKTFTFNKIK